MGELEDNNHGAFSSSLRASSSRLTLEERREKRRQKQLSEQARASDGKVRADNSTTTGGLSDEKIAQLIAEDEDQLLEFVARVNKVYQEKLHKAAPFMTFVFCGMQSAGKSTIMERFMSAVLNIVQEGTGTRCPLDTTCIHDDSLSTPRCSLSGNELEVEAEGEDLSVEETFQRILEHNRDLGERDVFSTEPLYLVFRSKKVQNMRFVDTPGIISNESTGKDNREDIKMILRSEMKKENTQLCVILEPKEFATNPIVDFCDKSLGGRAKWIGKATFLMTKFDKQLDDARTAGKANKFFKEFQNNQCFPHLVITPTLPKEDLPVEQLFKERMKLLESADVFEADKFEQWCEGHDQFRVQHGDENEVLSPEVSSRIGFTSAKCVMREILLRDTVERLPEVLTALRQELDGCQKEKEVLEAKMQFNDPNKLRLVVTDVMWHVEQRLLAYLDGDLESCMKFPDKPQTLEDEICEEEESDWAQKKLNFHTEKENHWRDRIAEMVSYPREVQASEKFLGGKQYQRAIEFFRAVMIDSLPDPFDLEAFVGNATGFLGGGLLRENWERATVQITKVLVKDVSHPGINYLIKHVGCIFRRLFALALDDIKQGEKFSSTFKLMPSAVEKYLSSEFDEMLWSLMESASETTHVVLEPMYSTVDPTLPTFHAGDFDQQKEPLFVQREGKYVPVKRKTESTLEALTAAWASRFTALVSATGKEAKSLLKHENHTRAMTKNSFLPDERTSMITRDEKAMILRRSFEYIVGLMEFNLYILKFQLNHSLYEGFKIEISRSFARKIASKPDWDDLIEVNEELQLRLNTLNDQIGGLAESLLEVQRMQRRM